MSEKFVSDPELRWGRNKVLITLRRDVEFWLGVLGFNRGLYPRVPGFDITTERDEYFWEMTRGLTGV